MLCIDSDRNVCISYRNRVSTRAGCRLYLCAKVSGRLEMWPLLEKKQKINTSCPASQIQLLIFALHQRVYVR